MLQDLFRAEGFRLCCDARFKMSWGAIWPALRLRHLGRERVDHRRDFYLVVMEVALMVLEVVHFIISS